MKDLELAKMVIKLGNSSGEDGELLARAVISLHEENERLRAGIGDANKFLSRLVDFGCYDREALGVLVNSIDALLDGKKE